MLLDVGCQAFGSPQSVFMNYQCQLSCKELTRKTTNIYFLFPEPDVKYIAMYKLEPEGT
jgi:hypothetical protein